MRFGATILVWVTIVGSECLAFFELVVHFGGLERCEYLSAHFVTF